MKFKQLNERIPPIHPHEITSWKLWDASTRERYVDELLHKYNVENSELLKPALRSSIVAFGLDPRHNPFIEYFNAFTEIFSLTSANKQLLQALVKLTAEGYVDKDMIPRSVEENDNYLLNGSLFNRGLKEFLYTVKVFEIVEDDSKLKQYFKDTSKVNIHELYVNNGEGTDQIKPAGSPDFPDDTNTIFGTLEHWADHGENDITKKSSKSKKHSRLTQRQKDQIRNNPETCVSDLDVLKDRDPVEDEIVFVWRDKHDPPFKNIMQYMKFTGGKWVVIDKWN